jgi:hypothetical protein
MRLRSLSTFNWIISAFTLLVLLQVSVSYAQTRINDKDMASLMKNLRDDAKNFPPPFKSALHKSVIRNTSQEKDAEKLADEFEKQTDEMWKRFKSKKKADSELRQVLNSAGQLDKLVYSLHMGDRTTTSWEIVRSALQEVANAYGVQVSYLHSNAWQTQ